MNSRKKLYTCYRDKEPIGEKYADEWGDILNKPRHLIHTYANKGAAMTIDGHRYWFAATAFTDCGIRVQVEYDLPWMKPKREPAPKKKKLKALSVWAKAASEAHKSYGYYVGLIWLEEQKEVMRRKGA